MTVTNNNRHQIESANTKSIELGFADFIVQELGPNENVLYDKQGQRVYQLTDDPFWPERIDDDFVKDKISRVKDCTIPARRQGIKICAKCVEEKSIYVAADGHVYPCSLTGVNPTGFKPYMRNPWRFYNLEIAEYVNNNHAPTVGLDTAIEWFQEFSLAWESDQQPRVCQNFCGN